MFSPPNNNFHVTTHFIAILFQLYTLSTYMQVRLILILINVQYLKCFFLLALKKAQIAKIPAPQIPIT